LMGERRTWKVQLVRLEKILKRLGLHTRQEPYGGEERRNLK